MGNAILKLQIEGMEQQLKILKAKIFKTKAKRKFANLYGIFKGKMDLTLKEIKKHEYSLKDNI
jgi:hypothetical protein